MGKVKWNLGIMVLNVGYQIRKYQKQPLCFSLRWNIGKWVLRKGYLVRGEIPQKTWKWNHI